MNSFHSRKFFPREIKLATDGLALIVNRDNPDSLLTVRDFSRILTGEAKDWKDINPNSRLKSIRWCSIIKTPAPYAIQWILSVVENHWLLTMSVP